jgi:tripartite-type tricarboxylate transporter receptor subunit TctC
MLQSKKKLLRFTVTIVSISLIFSAILLGLGSAIAADYPDPKKVLTLVVPWPAGGRTDLAVRAWAPLLEKELGLSVAVANNAGGGGIVGAEAVARSRPDGYTSGVFSISHIMGQYTKIPPMDFSRFEFVCTNYSFPTAVIVHAGSPWQTWDDVIAYSKKHPGKLKFAHPGAGSGDHILGEALAAKLGVEWQFIPYKGDAPAGVSLASKETDLWGAPVAAAVGLLKAGTVRVLGMASAERYPLYPEAPTHKEQGVDFVANLAEYQCMPKGTPLERIEIYVRAIKKVMNSPEVAERMKKIYVVPDVHGPAETRKYVEVTSARARPVLEKSGLWIAPKK